VGLLFKATVEQFGGVTVVVHCAGIMPLRAIVEDQDLSLFDQVITTNLRGSYAVMAESARHMTRGGRIIAFSSSEVAKSFPRYGAYSASKAAVESLVHTLANELRGREITVNAVAPGPVATYLFLKGKSQAQIDELTKLAPLERLAGPEDIVGTVSFLAGPDGAWVNSQVLRPNGGFV
jgi:3-oxoacyl-[acyl-carrier protein] reductase